MITILLGAGFEEMEAVAPCDLLRRAGLEVRFCGIGGTEITGSHGIVIRAEDTLETLDYEKMEMLVVPGGLRGVKTIRESEAALNLIRRTAADGRYLAAICAAPTILAELGLLAGKRATCYPDMQDRLGSDVAQNDSVVFADRIITARAAGSAYDFGLALIRVLKDSETAEKIAKGIVYHR